MALLVSLDLLVRLGNMVQWDLLGDLGLLEPQDLEEIVDLVVFLEHTDPLDLWALLDKLELLEIEDLKDR